MNFDSEERRWSWAHRLDVAMQDKWRARHLQAQAEHLLARFMDDALALHALDGIDLDADSLCDARIHHRVYQRPVQPILSVGRISCNERYL